jgi:hypothetical protein
MARDIFYPQLYKCPNPKCGKAEKYYVWQSELRKTKHKCILCETKITVKDIHFEEEVNVPAIKTQTKNRFYNSTSGKKEILEKYLHKPTLKESGRTVNDLV